MGSIFISEEACAPLRAALEETGHTVYTVKSTNVVYDAVSAHPDIYMCKINNVLVIDDSVVTEPDIKKIYMEELAKKADDFSEAPIIPMMRPKDSGGYIVFEMGGLGYEYPFDAAYNAAVTERFFIHNTKWTSPSLLDRARDTGLEILSVKQGYTKCSCVTAGNNALITADESIIRAVRGYNEMIREEIRGKEPAGARRNQQKSGERSGISGFSDFRVLTWNDLSEEDVQEDGLIDLLTVQKGYVDLKGFEYGFLGGASGCVDDAVYFNGDLSTHPDFEAIRKFLKRHGFRTVYFEGEPLTDIGSVIYLP